LIVAIVTAAGESTRFPWNKLLYNYSSKPLVVQTVENLVLSGFIERIIVVTGYMHDKVESTIRNYGFKVEFVYNPKYREGMSSSIKKGVEYILENRIDADGLLVNPADCAWIHPGIHALIAVKFYDYLNKYHVFIASYRGRRGHPVVFSREIIADLLSISEEKRGLKEITSKYADKTLIIETNYPGVVLDLDSINDILRVKSSLYI